MSIAGVKNTYEIDIDTSIRKCREQIAPKAEDEILPELTEAAPNDVIATPKPRRSLDVDRPLKAPPVHSFTPPPDFGGTKFSTSVPNFTTDSYNTSKKVQSVHTHFSVTDLSVVLTDVTESGLVGLIRTIHNL